MTFSSRPRLGALVGAFWRPIGPVGSNLRAPIKHILTIVPLNSSATCFVASSWSPPQAASTGGLRSHKGSKDKIPDLGSEGIGGLMSLVPLFLLIFHQYITMFTFRKIRKVFVFMMLNASGNVKDLLKPLFLSVEALNDSN